MFWSNISKDLYSRNEEILQIQPKILYLGENLQGTGAFLGIAALVGYSIVHKFNKRS